MNNEFMENLNKIDQELDILNTIPEPVKEQEIEENDILNTIPESIIETSVMEEPVVEEMPAVENDIFAAIPEPIVAAETEEIKEEVTQSEEEIEEVIDEETRQSLDNVSQYNTKINELMTEFKNILDDLNAVELFDELDITKTYMASDLSNCIAEKLNSSIEDYLSNYENK